MNDKGKEITSKEGETKHKVSIEEGFKQILETLRPEDQELVEHYLSEIWHGPLPSPTSIAEYESIVPGSAKRLFDEWQRESAHRRDMERTVVTRTLNQSGRGQIFAFVLVLILIGIGTYLTVTGYPTQGGIVFGTTIVGIASVFVIGKIFTRKMPIPEDE